MKISQAENLLFFINTLDVKGTIAFPLAVNKRKLETELKEFWDIKNSIIQKYGENGIITDKNPNFQKANEELKPYLEKEIEVNLMKVNDEDLRNSNLNIQQISFLMESMYGGEQ